MIALASAKRLAEFPDVPTVAETATKTPQPVAWKPGIGLEGLFIFSRKDDFSGQQTVPQSVQPHGLIEPDRATPATPE